MSNCKIIAIANQKGGVGKTTTTFSLGVELANNNKKVLLVDADSQANLTTYMGYYDKDDIPTISTLIDRYMYNENINSEQAIKHHSENVDLIPANLALSMTESNLINAKNREYAMRSFLNNLKDKYDYIIIDCMPSLNMVIINALACADKVIIPVQSQYLSAIGIGNLLNIVNQVKREINKKLEVAGILLTLVDKRTKLPEIIKEQVEKNYGNIVKLYDTQIPFAVKVAKSTSAGKSIFAYDKNNKVAEAYSQFAKEVLKDDEKERRRDALSKGYIR